MDKTMEMQLLLAKIPRGKVTTYKEIARKLKVHPRHAGRLLGRNPDGKAYPCYRVVRSDGHLGGYTSRFGVADKIRKLRKDGIEVKNNKIGLRKHLFKL
ncbi:MAG: MGMT family protein [Candidatus Aenigmatarchaeota archaeon]